MRRLCTSFKTASSALFSALAAIGRRLCTSFVDPDGLAPLLSSRLIALDKCPGVRPIGVAEIARRIIGKAIMAVIGPAVQDAAGSVQLCAGQEAGCEAAVHAMREIFSCDDTEAVLLVDARNTFNSLNSEVALWNIQVVCPALSTVAINTHRAAADLLIGGEVLKSMEGTIQGYLRHRHFATYCITTGSCKPDLVC